MPSASSSSSVCVEESIPPGLNVIGKIIITDGTYDGKVDQLGYLTQIAIEHHKVHEGVFYTISDYSNNIEIDTPKYWLIRTPNTALRFHAKINLECDSPSLLELFENPTLTTDGVALTARNNDRNSENVCSLQFYRDPTATNDGTRLVVARVGASRDKNLGGIARPRSEFILKQNEEYLVKITVDIKASNATINIEGYEA